MMNYINWKTILKMRFGKEIVVCWKKTSIQRILFENKIFGNVSK